MEFALTSNIKIIDLCLLIDKTLIISDIHIGYEEELNKKGILIPRLSFIEIGKRLEKIMKEVKGKIDTIIINGDIKHEFGTISEQEWRETIKIIDYLSQYGKLYLVRGNHDKTLGPIADKKNIELVESYTIGDILIAHGDTIIKTDNKIKTIIIGHEHPAVSIKEDNRLEKYKCFLKGKYEKKTLIVMPSFNPVTEGTDITKSEPLSPYLQGDLREFEVYIVSDKIYEFGKLEKFY